MKVYFALQSLLALCCRCNSLVTNRFAFNRKRNINLALKSSGSDSTDNKLSARTCIKNFLTQRSIQSFMFLQNELHDVNTINWLEEFSNTTNLLRFHGSGAFDMKRFPSWETIFVEMMAMPVTQLEIEVEVKGFPGGSFGLTKNRKKNPYLTKKVKKYTIDIDPSSLVSRIIFVREQIAKEFEQDLKIIATHGEEILESYFDCQWKDRDEECQLNNPSNSTDLESLVERKSSPFERHSLTMFHELKVTDGSLESSPLRKGSFDLLLLLVTQESIHRVLRNFRAQDSAESQSNLEWLTEFYTKRIPKMFDGSGKGGRSYDFLEDLLLTSPTLKKSSSQKMSIIDPLGLADEIIRMRTEVAHNWREAMRDVPLNHIDLRKILLEKQLEKVMFNSSSTDSDFDDKVVTPKFSLGNCTSIFE